jgi:hypothetical protein
VAACATTARNQRLHAIAEHCFQQFRAAREVPMQGGRPDSGAAGDLLQGRSGSGLGDHRTRRGHHTVAIALRISPQA